MISDDFSGLDLSGFWTLEGPAGTSGSLGVTGDEKFLSLTTSTGSHDIGTSNGSARALQPIADTDFEVEAKFLTLPTEGSERQGVLVEEDAGSWLWFDIYSDGTSLYAYAASHEAGISTEQISITIPQGESPNYLRVGRVGDEWTFSYSSDGANWNVAGTFTYALQVSAVGPFAASADAANGYTAEVDYFFDTATPISPEDGVTVSNDAEAPPASTAVIIASGQSLMDRWFRDSTGLQDGVVTTLSAPDQVTGFDLANRIASGDTTVLDLGNGTYQLDGLLAADRFALRFLEANPQYDDIIVVRASSGGASILEGSNSSNFFFDSGATGAASAVGDGTGNYDGLTLSTVAKPAIDAALTGATDLELVGVMLAQGEADALNLGNDRVGESNEALYATGLEYLFDELINYTLSNYGSQFNQTITPEVYIQSLGRRSTSSNELLEGTDEIIEIQQALADSRSDVNLASASYDLALIDTVHLSRDGWHTLAERMVEFISTGNRGPEVQSIQLKNTFSGARVTIDLKLPDGFTAADIILGDDAIDQLEVFDSLSTIDGDDFDPSTSIDAVSVSLVGSQLVYELERQIVGDGLIQIAYASPMASGTLTGFGDQDSTVEPVALENGDLDLPIGPYRQTFTASEIAPPGSPPNAVDDTATTNEDTAVVIDVLANDTDPDLDPLTVTSVGPASNGQVAINPDDTVTYTPNADFNGVDSFQVTVNDGGADSVSTVTVTVNAVNDDPTAVDDFAAAVLDAPVIIDATANDIDIDGDLLDIVSVGPTANGGFVVNNGDGTLTYTRAAGFLGQDSFTYTVDDMAGGATSTANVTVYVLSSPNAAPVAVADSIAVDEDGSFNFQPGANDTDADGDTIVAFAIATAPSNGAAVVEADGTVTYTPTAGYFGADSFEVTVTDGRGGFDTAVVSVNVNAVNDDPVAADDAANTFEGAPVVVDVLANDSDSDSPGPLTVSAVGAATSGTVVNNGGSVTYQPNAGFSGVDTFDYTVSDGQGGFDTATVTVNVAALPSPVYETSGEIAFDGSNANVIELDPLPIYDFAEGTISFEFNASSLGKDRGLFARDASGLSGNGNHIAIYVDQSTLKARLQDGVNTTFLTFGGIAAGASYDVALVFAASGSELYVNGVLVDSDAITTSWAGSPEFLQFGSLGWASNSGQSGFRSSNNFRGTISDQKIFSEALNSDQIAELHTDGPVNLDPIAVDDTAATNEDVAVNINVAANDSDPDGGTPAATGIASQGADGTAVLNPDGTVTYTPNANFFGADSFQVTIGDGQGGSVVSTVNVTVAPVNDDPVANNDTGQTVLDTPVIIDVTANDMDADGDTPQIIGTTDGGNGAVVDNGDGTVTYTPNAGYVGGDSFTYTIDDGQGGALAQATVTVDVLAAPNTPPAAVEDSVSLGEDGSLTFQPGDNDVDADGDTVIAAAILSGPSNGGAVVNPDGTVTYTPNADFFGADSFLVQMTDGNGGFDQATVSVTVTAVNDAPTANDDAGNTQVDQPLVINVLANDTDVDPDTLSVVAVGTPSNGQAVDNGDGTVTYTPNAGFSGTDTFTYDVNDGTVTRTATVTVAVSAFPTPIFEALGSTTFSGASADVVELAHAPIYSTPEGAVTFSFTASDTNGRQGLFTKDASGFAGGGNHLAVYLDGSTLKARFQDGANSVTLEQSGIQTGVEYDIAVVFSAAGAQLYVDSVSVGSDPIVMDWTQNVEAIQWGALGWGSASGAFGYKNRDNFTGTISDKRVFDTALSAPQVAEIFGAEPGNFDPVAVDDSLTVTEDGSGSLDPAANDTDPDGGTPVALGIASQGANGTAALNPDGTVTYTPNANFFGADSFQVTIGDGQGGSAVSTVDVTVSGTEDDPIANGDTAAAQQGVATIIDLLANDLELDGETLSIVSLGTPSNGSVTENGDGTVTYTSDPGFTGMATFTYEISDGAGPTSTATATVTVTAGPPAASPIESDDFSAVALAPIWTYKGITGSPSLQVSGNEGYLEIGSPPGVPVDAYTSLTTPRLLQAVPDDDFQIEVKFLNEPTQAFQEHGLLVVQDATTWIRFDLAYTSSGLDLLVGVVTDSGRSFPLDLGVSSGDASHLRITRVGDQFTFDYSGDGQNWTTAITLNQTMVVNEVGPFAGSAPKNGVTPGWISQVDYFYNSASPIASEDGGLFQPDPPNARDDAIAAEPNTANTIDIAVDLLANDSDPDGDPITFDTFTQPTNGAIVDNGDGTLIYTPNPGFSGPDSFTYTIIAAGETDTATVTVNVETPPPSSNIVSDDFASPTLNSIWSIEGGTGVAGDVGEAGLDGYLILSTPTGNYDMWQGTYNAARAMQAADNGDFEIEAKFLTQVSDRFELQGIVVEQDADNWIRFDTYTNGSTHYVFAAVTLNGSSDQKLKIVVSAGDAQYLRVSRSGDVWTYSYSADGQVWNVAGSFTQALTVTEVGPFAGSTNSAGGYAAQVDYFFNTASRIDPEDGTLFDPAPPNARDDAIAAEPNTANTIDIAVDLLANDSDPDGDPITFDTFTQPTNGAIVDNGDGTLTYTPNPGFSGPDSFTYTIIAAGETDTATVTVNVETPPPSSNIVS
ncbi:MAG: Ig-like domain-containing protein, partial [Pseudomonadota bacterium]